MKDWIKELILSFALGFFDWSVYDLLDLRSM